MCVCFCVYVNMCVCVCVWGGGGGVCGYSMCFSTKIFFLNISHILFDHGGGGTFKSKEYAHKTTLPPPPPPPPLHKQTKNLTHIPILPSSLLTSPRTNMILTR